ncbi:MAG TPA: substrate-binding domain-containing protein [Xanthobacteraceae bacterium]|nr:substrate-binding domain-containing protein [Xanthobacteraceae bacterium]
MKLLSALAVKALVEPALSVFTAQSGRRVETVFGTMGALRARLEQGEAADAAILTAPLIEALQRQGTVGEIRLLARTGIGVAICAGAARPDLSSREGLIRTLLSARSVALTDPQAGGTAGVYLADLMRRLGLAEALAPKTRLQPNGLHVAQCVASGDADIGLTLISEIVAVSGAAVAGPLPPPLQLSTTYGIGFLSGGDHAAAAQLMNYIADPAMHPRWAACGFEIPQS